MIRRIAIPALIIIASLVIGGALVGFDIISPNIGAVLWLICIGAAIVVFFRLGKESRKSGG